MRFDGFPLFLEMAAKESKVSAARPDGTPDPAGSRTLELVRQNVGLRSVCSAIGQAVEARPEHRRAILAVAVQHASALALAARTATLIVDSITEAMDREDAPEPEPEPTAEPDTETDFKPPARRGKA